MLDMIIRFMNHVISLLPITPVTTRIGAAGTLILCLALLAPVHAQDTNEILAINPDSATQGTVALTVSFTLDTDSPPAPPAGIMPTSVTVGSISGTSVTHSSQYTVTAVFTFAVSEPTGTRDVSIVFPTPQGTLTFLMTDGFTVTPGEPTPTITPGGPTATPTPALINTFPIVDTGQSACYNASTAITCPAPGDAFYGQDAQFDGNQPAFELSGDGLTVIDIVTGLTWQHTTDSNTDGSIDIDDKMTWAEAQQYPAALNALAYGGYSDWRLPSIKELYSLIDFRGTDPSGYSGSTEDLIPFIDTDYFEFGYGDEAAGERIIDAQYASSTLYVSPAFGQSLFGVNFADGRIKGYGLTLMGSDKTFYVQCVRGNPQYGINNYLDNGDGTVSDLATGLMWTQSDSETAMNWQSALAWVEARNVENHLGYNDWRLPNAKELESILDYTRSPDTSGSAAIDPVFETTAFTNEGGSIDYPWYWTGTTHVTYNGSAAAAAYVCFGRGLGWMQEQGNTCYSCIDVHGAGAQRSDPKSGSPTSYYLGEACNGGSAYGHGPQGDIIRISNYIRMVRNTPYSLPTPTPTGECLHHGDVNADQSITAGDAQAAFLIVLGAVTPTWEEACAADCNGDGSVTAGDAQQIFLTALGSGNCADPT